MTWLEETHEANVVSGNGSQQEKIEDAISVLETHINKHTAFLWTGGKEAQVIGDLLLYTIGERRETSPVDWFVIDTRNHFDKMYKFREEFIAATGDQGRNTVGPPTGLSCVEVIEYTEMLQDVILNPEDPRGYHGKWDSTVDLPDEIVIEGLPRTPEEWGVPESCGALKTIPIKRIINDREYSRLITGRRGEDPLTPEKNTELDIVVDRNQPSPHTRINPLADWTEANVYAYIKQEIVQLSELYTEDEYRHTDSECCVDTSDIGEYGEGGRDPEKRQAREALEDMGYV